MFFFPKKFFLHLIPGMVNVYLYESSLFTDVHREKPIGGYCLYKREKRSFLTDRGRKEKNQRQRLGLCCHKHSCQTQPKAGWMKEALFSQVLETVAPLTLDFVLLFCTTMREKIFVVSIHPSL